MSRRRTRVTGVGRIVRKLREITEAVGRRTMKNGVDEAAKRILKDARANVPTDTKLLKKALGKKLKVYKKRLVAVGIVGPRKHMTGKKGSRTRTKKFQTRTDSKGREVTQDPLKYAHLVEFGTRPHRLHKGASLDLRREAGRETAKFEAAGLFEHHPMHPGARPQPFLRPAFDRNRSVAKALLARMLGAALKKFRRK